MDNIISLIERLGADSMLRRDAAANLIFQKISDTAVQQLITDGNVAELEKILNVRHKIVCMIAPAEPEQEPEDDDGENEKVVSAVSNG